MDKEELIDKIYNELSKLSKENPDKPVIKKVLDDFEKLKINYETEKEKLRKELLRTKYNIINTNKK